ncbi:MAG: hypothetical protein KKD39_05475, partial [Candidatus Altiarchaeota archaeon]|nr:hypothetical protein [Candidatus Altiarchaeota archaeon]
PIRENVFQLEVNIYTSPLVSKEIREYIKEENKSIKLDSVVKTKSAVKALPLDAAKTAPISPIFTQFSLMLILVLVLGYATKKGLSKFAK